MKVHEVIVRCNTGTREDFHTEAKIVGRFAEACAAVTCADVWRRMIRAGKPVGRFSVTVREA